MTMVNTVLGPIDTSKLGVTLAHEHILELQCRHPPELP